MNIAAEVFDARQKLRDAGKETVINVLGAESELFNARINLVSAQHDARVAVYRLMIVMGRLSIETSTNLSALPKVNKIVSRNQESNKSLVKLEDKQISEKPAITKTVATSTSSNQQTKPRLNSKQIARQATKENNPVRVILPQKEVKLVLNKPLKAVIEETNIKQTITSKKQLISVNQDENFVRLWPYE